MSRCRNLDAKLRVEMRAYIARLHQELGTTTLYVTHDQTEAMTMGDRVAVMRDGRLEQVDTPVRLYERPVNVFVAGFIGSPAMNLLRGTVSADGVVSLGSQTLRLARRTSLAGDVIVGIRPEAVTPVAELGDDVLELRVVLAEMLGSDVLLHLHSEAAVGARRGVRSLRRARPARRPAGAGRRRPAADRHGRASTCSTR